MSKVLLIDDEVLLRDSVAAYLEDDGHRLLTTASAESALSKLSQFLPDVIIVDLRLEGVNGEDFIKAAAKLYPQGRYIIHTGCKDYHLPEELKQIGLDEHQILFKPLPDLSEISRLIDHLVEDSVPQLEVG